MGTRVLKGVQAGVETVHGTAVAADWIAELGSVPTASAAMLGKPRAEAVASIYITTLSIVAPATPSVPRGCRFAAPASSKWLRAPKMFGSQRLTQKAGSGTPL